MPHEFSPFGQIVLFLGVAIAIPIVFVFMWPGGVSRRAAFLSATFLAGAILACVVFFWHLAPLANVGISGGPITPDAAERTAQFEYMLVRRFYIALCMLVLAQATVSKISQSFLSR